MRSDEIGSRLRTLEEQLDQRASRKLAEAIREGKEDFQNVFPPYPGSKGAQINEWTAPFNESEREQIRGATNASPSNVLTSLCEIMRQRCAKNATAQEAIAVLEFMDRETKAKEPSDD